MVNGFTLLALLVVTIQLIVPNHSIFSILSQSILPIQMSFLIKLVILDSGPEFTMKVLKLSSMASNTLLSCNGMQQAMIVLKLCQVGIMMQTEPTGGVFLAKKNTQNSVKPPIPVVDENGDFKYPPPAYYHPILSQKSEKEQFVTKFDLPESWDWRNINGANYVSPVRDQKQCGSCYAFGTLAMIESRIRIMTNNQKQPVLSTQNIVSCSEYSQGCAGGFPYLVSKYGQDFQYFSEDCFPYTARDSPCTPCDLSKTDLYHATGYYYVGGHYGGCSPEEMLFEVYINGPVAVSFEVYDDFYSYTGGVYIHNTTSVKRMNEWEVTNHAVCLVGWGVDEASGIPYWIVKNSWGTGFGENGYFRIRRNTDECAIESMAMSARPVLPN